MPRILNPMCFTICWQSSYFTPCIYDWFSSHKKLVKYQVVPFFQSNRNFVSLKMFLHQKPCRDTFFRYIDTWRWGEVRQKKIINQHTMSIQRQHLDLEMQVCSSSVCACRYTPSSRHVYICSQTQAHYHWDLIIASSLSVAMAPRLTLILELAFVHWIQLLSATRPYQPCHLLYTNLI